MNWKDIFAKEGLPEESLVNSNAGCFIVIVCAAIGGVIGYYPGGETGGIAEFIMAGLVSGKYLCRPR